MEEDRGSHRVASLVDGHHQRMVEFETDLVLTEALRPQVAVPFQELGHRGEVEPAKPLGIAGIGPRVHAAEGNDPIRVHRKAARASSLV